VTAHRRLLQPWPVVTFPRPLAFDSRPIASARQADEVDHHARALARQATAILGLTGRRRDVCSALAA
jgi:hypothetical protein